MNRRRLQIRVRTVLPLILLLASLALRPGQLRDPGLRRRHGSAREAPWWNCTRTSPPNGSKTVEDGVLPSNHAQHETLEITQGFNSWFETGFYVFTSIQPDGGWQWVGDHIRPRVRVPESWHWPVGVSLSNEFGYQRRDFSPDTWTWEIRPIVDKKIGRWYLSFNPTLERSLHGENVNKGVEFSPNAKVSFDFTKKNQRRAGVLRGLRIAQRLRSPEGSAAAVLSVD